MPPPYYNNRRSNPRSPPAPPPDRPRRNYRSRQQQQQQQQRQHEAHVEVEHTQHAGAAPIPPPANAEPRGAMPSQQEMDAVGLSQEFRDLLASMEPNERLEVWNDICRNHAVEQGEALLALHHEEEDEPVRNLFHTEDDDDDEDEHQGEHANADNDWTTEDEEDDEVFRALDDDGQSPPRRRRREEAPRFQPPRGRGDIADILLQCLGVIDARQSRGGRIPARYGAERALLMQLNEAIAQQAMGVEGDIDDMTYEQLLELEERVGNVPNPVSGRALSSRTHLVAPPSTDGSERCTICLEPYCAGESCRQLVCKHTFHAGCVDCWFKDHNTCPICKNEVA